MKQFHSASLVKFFSECKEHQDILAKNNAYPFHDNLMLIKNFLEDTDFPGGVDIDENDYKTYVVEESLMIGIDLVNDDLDEYKYLFDAFNVYFCQEGSLVYTQDPTLTKAWRKTMKNYYHNTTYLKNVQKLLQQEFKEKQDKLIEEFNQDNIDLL